MKTKKKILVLNGQYLPGYKGGGPIQSCVNMVENLYDQYDFYILCADRDYKSEHSYENIKIDGWNKVGHAQVYYMSPEKQKLSGFKEILNNIDYDILYLNGFFSPIFTIRPLLLRKLGKLKNKDAQIILTPRGDFTGGCENKKIKKYGYIYFAKLVGLYNNLLWHATSDIEEKDIRGMFTKAEIFTIPNLPTKFVPKKPITGKNKGELRLVFVSRIFPKKNIKYALEILRKINEGNIIFDIYGPMEDSIYWRDCEEVIKELPKNIKVMYRGEVEHKEIPHVFEQYHAFFFPTLGENYGHVIVEAMMNNCLCILSKKVTPWDEYIEMLDIGAELDDNTKFVEIINRLLSMNNEEFLDCLKLNSDYVYMHTKNEELVSLYKKKLGEEGKAL